MKRIATALIIIISCFLSAVSSAADRSPSFKDSSAASSCQEPFVMTTETGQNYAAIVSTPDKKGRCTDHLIFDPNAALSGSIAEPYTQSQSAYFDLAAHYAPIWYQDVDGYQVRSEFITNFNYDGDWVANNNWESTALPLYAYIYYSVVETSTHWFIGYGVFHPRDWMHSSLTGFCPSIGGLSDCHENDFEGAQVIVRKDGTPFGQLVLVETLAHDVFHLYSSHADVTGRSKGIESIVPMDGTHPKIYIESEGHGIYIDTGITGGDGFSNGNFPGGDGIVYRYTGTAQEPASGNEDNVGYALLSLTDELWVRRLSPNQMYTQYFQYNGVRFSSGQSIGGTFIGDNFTNDRAHPSWSWDDTGDGNVNKGDWAMDPAYAISQHANIAHAYSTDYVDNFYLGPLGNIITVDQNNASQYFTLRTVGGGIGSKSNCQENGANRWCMENGIPHWPQNIVGCYEIADDNCSIGNCDCKYDSSHSNYITYAWNKTNYPYRLDQIDHIIVRTMTKQSVCSGSPGYEGDDGWRYNSSGGYILSLLLSQSNGWGMRYCESGSAGGPYEVTAGFDVNSLLDAITVRAGDHHDEGAFEVMNADVVLKPMCTDGTIVDQCNAGRQYCNEQLNLEYNCHQCGYLCPAGYFCASSNQCQVPGKKCPLEGCPQQTPL